MKSEDILEKEDVCMGVGATICEEHLPDPTGVTHLWLCTKRSESLRSTDASEPDLTIFTMLRRNQNKLRQAQAVYLPNALLRALCIESLTSSTTAAKSLHAAATTTKTCCRVES
jgi:hypothetical protein